MLRDCYYLVYQCGLANVFRRVHGGRIMRVLQADFRACEFYVRGASSVGFIEHPQIKVRHCDRAGDIAPFMDQWADGPGEMFADSKNPPATDEAKNVQTV